MRGKTSPFPPLNPSWHCHSMHQTTTHSLYRPFFSTGINSVRILIKASYQTVLNCLLLDHFLSSINFPSEQALKLGFDLMAPFWTHLKKISFIFDFQITILFLSSSPPFEFFFSMYNACDFAKNSNFDIENWHGHFLCTFVVCWSVIFLTFVCANLLPLSMEF